MNDRIHHGINVSLPDDAALVTASLAVVSFVKDDGQLGYTVSVTGEQPMLSYLGMTTAAEHQIVKWNDQGNDDA